MSEEDEALEMTETTTPPPAALFTAPLLLLLVEALCVLFERRGVADETLDFAAA